MKALLSVILFLTIFATACSPKQPGEKSQGVLTDAQAKTLEKSKQVEKVLKDADEKRMKDTGEEVENK